MPTPSLTLSGKPQAHKIREVRQHMHDLFSHMVADSSDELFTQYLNCAAHFWRYSASNVGLILLQAPTATRVAGHTTWRRLNRHIRKGAHGIFIWAPSSWSEQVADSETGEVTTVVHHQFVLVPVYDVADTEVFAGARDLYVPTFHRDLGDVEPLFQAVVSWAESAGYRLEFRPMFRQIGLGYAAQGDRIVVDNTGSQGEKMPVLLHEIAHQLLDHIREGATREFAEGEAETTAYLVLRHYGYQTPTSVSAAYLRQAGVTQAMITASFRRIFSAAKTLIEGIEAHLPPAAHETAQSPIEPLEAG